MSSWSSTFSITKKPWLAKPDQRWNAGLKAAGFNFRTGLSRAHYPPLSPSPHKRTYQTADKAGFRVIEEGRKMEFGSTFYLPFILFGTDKWPGWPGKIKELKDLMQKGFAAGIRNFTG